MAESFREFATYHSSPGAKVSIFLSPTGHVERIRIEEKKTHDGPEFSPPAALDLALTSKKGQGEICINGNVRETSGIYARMIPGSRRTFTTPEPFNSTFQLKGYTRIRTGDGACQGF